jgi:hypothetical protein
MRDTTAESGAMVRGLLHHSVRGAGLFGESVSDLHLLTRGAVVRVGSSTSVTECYEYGHMYNDMT